MNEKWFQDTSHFENEPLPRRKPTAQAPKTIVTKKMKVVQMKTVEGLPVDTRVRHKSLGKTGVIKQNWEGVEYSILWDDGEYCGGSKKVSGTDLEVLKVCRLHITFLVTCHNVFCVRMNAQSLCRNN